jgi:hypothetical protein
MLYLNTKGMFLQQKYYEKKFQFKIELKKFKNNLKIRFLVDNV